MSVDRDKLQELAYSLSEDQRQMLREGLAGGENLDVAALSAALNSAENQRVLQSLAEDSSPDDAPQLLAADAPDGGTGDAGTVDAGTGDAGTSHPVPAEPPLTRW